VSFTPVLVVYGLFVDWQTLRERLRPGQISLFESVPSRSLVWATLILAVGGGILWNYGTGLRTAINLDGLLNWRTIWYPVLLLSLVWWLLASRDLVRSAGGILDNLRSRQTTLPADSRRS
jgi:hypothetical protein